jgi:hypothetical protein
MLMDKVEWTGDFHQFHQFHQFDPCWKLILYTDKRTTENPSNLLPVYLFYCFYLRDFRFTFQHITDWRVVPTQELIRVVLGTRTPTRPRTVILTADSSVRNESWVLTSDRAVKDSSNFRDFSV